MRLRCMMGRHVERCAQDDRQASRTAAASEVQLLPAHQLHSVPTADGMAMDASSSEQLNNAAHHEQLHGDGASPARLAATVFEGVKAKIETLQALLAVLSAS